MTVNQVEIPRYTWKYSKNGCKDCAFSGRLDIKCSRIPCHKQPVGMVAKIVRGSNE